VLRWQNVSYRRDLLLAYGSDLSPLLGSEGTLFRQLRDRGHSLYVAPDAKLVHAHETRWTEFLRGSYYSNRSATAANASFLRLRALGRLARATIVLGGIVRWPVVLMQRTRRLQDHEVWVPFARTNLLRVFQYYVVVGRVCWGWQLVPATAPSGSWTMRSNGPRRRPDRLPRAASY
jgi:hypothetical protein